MEVKIEEHTCATHGCGLTFWFTENFGNRRRADHLEYYCPNGHSLIYKGETDAQKLSRITLEKNAEIERLRREVAACKKPKRGRPKKNT